MWVSFAKLIIRKVYRWTDNEQRVNRNDRELSAQISIYTYILVSLEQLAG